MDRERVTTELLDELTSYSHQPTAAMRGMRRWHGGALSLVHLNVLLTLETGGPIPMRVLAETLDVSQASATGIVDRMEQRGLVERQRDDEDRRVIRVALSDQGHAMVESMASERRERLKEIVDEMSDEELSGFLLGARAMRRGRERLHARLVAEAAQHEAAR